MFTGNVCSFWRLWELGFVGENKVEGEGLCDPLEIRSERKRVSSYRAGDKTGETGSWEQ